MDEFENVDNDGLNPPEGSCPDEVEGATGYIWDPTQQCWQPVFGNESQG